MLKLPKSATLPKLIQNLLTLKKTASKQDTTQIPYKDFWKENGFGTSEFQRLRNISMDYENSAYKLYGETLIMMSLRTF
jgi:hypothetical protein